MVAEIECMSSVITIGASSGPVEKVRVTCFAHTCVCMCVCLFRCVCVSLRVSKLAILYSLNVGAVTGDIFNLSIFINSTNDILFLQGSSSFGAQNTPAQSVSKKTSVKLKLLVR